MSNSFLTCVRNDVDLVPLACETVPHGAVGRSVICDCGISWSYSLVIILDEFNYFHFHSLIHHLGDLEKLEHIASVIVPFPGHRDTIYSDL